MRGGLKVCAVKAPGFGDRRKAMLQDIAVLTGATVVSEELGMSLETADLSVLGTAKKVTVGKENTVIVGAVLVKKLKSKTVLVLSVVKSKSPPRIALDKEKFQKNVSLNWQAVLPLSKSVRPLKPK